METIFGIKVYSQKETAIKLKISQLTLKNYTKQGKINAQRIGKRLCYTQENIIAFIQNSKQ